VKEQVESLGAKFIDVPYETAEEKEAAEGVGGYARPMPPSWLERQKAEVAKRVAQADVVISTALIPGRPAPVLISEEMVKSMKPGSVIVDLAAPAGGNCPLTEPGQTVVKHGVTLPNAPATIDSDYRGEIVVGLINHGTEPFLVERGMRIAQMVLGRVPRIVWQEVEALAPSARGEGGFGHTGVR